MKRLLVITAIAVQLILLVGCEALPEGDYDVYPASGQVITPGSTFEAQGRHFTLREPVPDATVTPTPSPTATPPPVTEPSPTQELTPVPTLPPSTPVKWHCVGGVQAGYRVRSGPRTDNILGNTTGLLGQSLRFEARRNVEYQGNTELWYAFWYSPEYYGWIIDEAITTWEQTECGDLPADPPPLS